MDTPSSTTSPTRTTTKQKPPSFLIKYKNSPRKPPLKKIPQKPSQRIPDDMITDPTTTPPTGYFRGQFLGKGSYATCYKLISTKYPYLLACKITQMAGTCNRTTERREKVLQEVAIHSTLDHPNIVKLHSSFEQDGLFYMVLEYCDNRSLMEMLEDRGPLTEPEAAHFIGQVCSAVAYLHEEKSVIHHDLKLANVFVTAERQVKIGDFGLASVHEPGSLNMTTCGTPNYIAPEIFAKLGHSFEADIWSIGVLLYILLTGRPPFVPESYSQQKKLVIEGKFTFPHDIDLSPEAVNLIKRILQVDPAKRPKAREILSDAFITRKIVSYFPVESSSSSSSGSSGSGESSSDSCSCDDGDEVTTSSEGSSGEITLLTSFVSLFKKSPVVGINCVYRGSASSSGGGEVRRCSKSESVIPED